MIQRMFKWIVCAREPIKLEELREAVAFTLEDLTYDPGKLPTDMNRLVRACGNLVVIDKESQVIQLAHHTVQQYLLQQDSNPFQFTIKDANVMAGEFCVAYLSLTNFETQIIRYAENKNTDMLALGRIASRRPMLSVDHPGQKVVRALNTLRGPRPNNVEIDMKLYVPPQKAAWLPANFAFLSYVVSHWLWHTTFFYIDDVADVGRVTHRDTLFRNLILRKQLIFDFRPWGNFNRDAEESSSISILGWALMANHRYLIQMASSDIALPSLTKAWVATCGKYYWAGDGDPQGAIEPWAPYHMHLLDLDANSSKTSDSPPLVWLFSRLSLACQKGHIDAIKELEIKNLMGTNPDPSTSNNLNYMIQYLHVAAAACGELQMVKYLWHKIIAPFNEFMVVSNLTKSHPLGAIEHAAISGHIHVVSYLADQGARSRCIFMFSGLFQRFLNEAISGNNIRTVESLLLLVNISIYPGYCFMNEELSAMLVDAIKDGHTEVARLMLKYGVETHRQGLEIRLIT
jgi:hypothetical protein